METEFEILFLEHPTFAKEIEKFNRKHDNGIGYKSLKKLLQVQFHPLNPQIVLTPKTLKRIDNIGINIHAFKVIMAVKNIKSGQCPRVCFRVERNSITFLCYGSHTEDYRDSELRGLIKKRAKELDPDLQLR